MAKATITLSDTDGALDLFCDYGEGGLNEFSPAHQAARRLVDLMGEILEPTTEQIHLTAEEVKAMRINSSACDPIMMGDLPMSVAELEASRALSPAAENAAQFAKLRAPEDASDDLWVRLHTLSKTLESSGVIDSHANPEAYGTILDAMKALAETQG